MKKKKKNKKRRKSFHSNLWAYFYFLITEAFTILRVFQIERTYMSSFKEQVDPTYSNFIVDIFCIVSPCAE